jgi:Ca2+-binding RTX toxin-like protein
MTSRVLSGSFEKSDQQGDYVVVNNDWGNDGRSHTQTITIDNTADLSGGIHMSWDWGTVGNKVLAYPEVSVGYKPWDAPGTGTGALSAQISDIRTFTLSHDLTINGSTNDFDVAYDLWLTNTPLGNQNSINTELMIWTHKGGPDGFGTDPATGNSAIVGTYEHHGVTFDLVKYENFSSNGVNWRYLALVPQTDIPDASVNVRDILTDLINRGYVSENDYVTGFELGAEIVGGQGSLDVNHLSYSLGRYGADDGNDRLVGTSGRDRIFGHDGSDTISGKAGSDWLVGGLGRDRLAGGRGNDTFVFNDLSKGFDRVVDFKPGADHIALDSGQFAALSKGGLLAQAFEVGSSFDSGSQLLYKEGSGKLYYDGDGSGTAQQAHLIAVLENHAALTSSDFLVL